jgi:RNA polymerase sigma-19 factor, ECF subfamily
LTDARPAVLRDERVERLRQDDVAAFEAIFRDYHGALCSFAGRYVHAPDIAEEIVQDVFANLWRTRATLRIDTSLRAWLFTSVRNRSLNHIRRAAPEHPIEPEIAVALATRSTPETDLEARRAIERVRAAISALPPRSRETVVLRWIHGLSHAEIAETMGVSKKAVENNLTRAIRSLRSLLGDLGD